MAKAHLLMALEAVWYFMYINIKEKFWSKFQVWAIFRDFWSRSRRNHFLDIAFFRTF
jgi:hypothetical protein